MSPWLVLTPRGRVLAGSGIALLAIGLLLSEIDLGAAGVMCLSVCVIAYLMTFKSVPRIGIERTVAPACVPIGEQLQVELKVLCPARSTGCHTVMLEEYVPAVMGQRPRFVVAQDHGPNRQYLSYHLHAQQRGRFQIGPVLADQRDALGLTRTLRAHNEVSDVLVTPMIWPLLPAGSVTASGRAGSIAPQRAGLSGENDVMVREYRPGDDTRRIHWRSSARIGSLMVRREQQVWDPAALVLCDSRTRSLVGEGPGCSLEWVISAATSVAVQLKKSGYRVDLLDASGTLSSSEGSDLLAAAADIPYCSDTSLLNAVRQAGGREHRMVVAVLADPTMNDAHLVQTLHDAQSTAVALIFHTRSVLGPGTEPTSEHRQVAAWLEAHGWHAAMANAQIPLQQAWAAATSGGLR